MTSEVRSVPVTTRPMDKNTPLRNKSMRILRLLEVSETRRASGVAWECGRPSNSELSTKRQRLHRLTRVRPVESLELRGIHLVKRSNALRDFGVSMRGADDSPRMRGSWAPPLSGVQGRPNRKVPRALRRAARPSIRPIEGTTVASPELGTPMLTTVFARAVFQLSRVRPALSPGVIYQAMQHPRVPKEPGGGCE